MKASPRFRSIPAPRWLLGALAVSFLTGCALNPGTEAPQAAPDDVDVGYGTVEQTHVTGSVATLTSDEWEDSQPRTLADMLARIPGVRVVQLTQLHGGISVRIRGASNSLIAGEEPLFVLDGMPISTGNGEIFNLSPHTIESITVLKDAGSTAIYGSRGANGVILIKTKRGTE